MPELPEVETVKRGLEPALMGQKLIKVIARRPDLRTPLPDRFVDRLEGRTVANLRRRAKYVLVDLDDGTVLLIHLGMSGRIRIFEGDDGAPDKHDHVEFHTQDGHVIRYGDPRRFGLMDLIAPGEEDSHAMLGHLGPEPLGNSFSADVLIEAFAGRKTPLKSALLDQKIVAGLGNIYVCEALHRAGLSPKRLAKNTSRAKIEVLTGHIRDVLREAIAAGGSSLRDHRQTDGELGYFQHTFKVYGQEGEACQSCPDGTVRRIVQSGRSTFYCPSCQR